MLLTPLISIETLIYSLFLESPYNSQTKSEESLHKRTASEKSKRRMKIADLKTFVETKLLSKSDKALEKIGQEEQQKPLGQVSVGQTRMLNVCIFFFSFLMLYVK